MIVSPILADPTLACICPNVGSLDGPDSAFAALLLAVQQHGVLAVDTETVSLTDRTAIGVGLWSENVGLYISGASPLLPKALDLLADKRFTKLYFNSSFDLSVLRRLSYELDSPDRYIPTPDCYNIADVSLMTRVQALPNGLSECAHFVLQLVIDEISDILPKRKSMLDLKFSTVAAKCLDDVKATWRLYWAMNGSWWRGQSSEGINWHPPAINPLNFYDPTRKDSYYVSTEMRDRYQVDIKLIPILLDMGERGIALRPDRVLDWDIELEAEEHRTRAPFEEEGINPASSSQVGRFLSERGNILPMTKSYKQYRANEEVLSKLTDPWAALALKFREVSKLRSTYITPAVGQSRMYSNYRLDLATGRLASSSRNMQNIPVRVRDIFKADSGTFTCGDASQIEMRMFSWLSQDPVMLKAYQEGIDVHALTQLALWPGSDINNKSLRTLAKNFNFAMLADADPKVLSSTVGLPVDVCREFKETWYELYPNSLPWIRRVQQEGRDQGYAETIYGRKMRLPRAPQANERHIDECAVNYPFQGSAADYVKMGLLWCSENGLVLATQVHDEILLDGDVEFPKELEFFHPELPVPFNVHKGEYWEKA
jgi:hypothetical protein